MPNIRETHPNEYDVDKNGDFLSEFVTMCKFDGVVP